MRRLAIITIITTFWVASVTHAIAAPKHKVLVLPVEGASSPAMRATLNDTLKRLSKSIEGEVTTGDTTFGETAAAVGCDPHTPSCVDDVMAMLGVDELIWGTATTTDGQTVVVVRRGLRKTPWQEVSATIATNEPPEKAEPQLAVLFGAPPPPPIDVIPPIDEPLPPGPPNTDRNLGIGLVAGGGFLLLVGLVLWGNESSAQDQIDSHPTDTLKDFHDLEDLESRATKYALVGDLFVLGGLALGGYGGWLLYQHSTATVVARPMMIEGGAGVSIELIGGLR